MIVHIHTVSITVEGVAPYESQGEQSYRNGFDALAEAGRKRVGRDLLVQGARRAPGDQEGVLEMGNGGIAPPMLFKHRHEKERTR